APDARGSELHARSRSTPQVGPGIQERLSRNATESAGKFLRRCEFQPQKLGAVLVPPEVQLVGHENWASSSWKTLVQDARFRTPEVDSGAGKGQLPPLQHDFANPRSPSGKLLS